MAVTRVLISVKTYPILSATYDELVCTAGFREDGSWIRIYPVPYRKLKYADRYEKWQWIEIDIVRNTRDFRKESYRPVDLDKDIITRETIPTTRNWLLRKEFALKNVYYDMSLLINEAQDINIGTSLAVLKPKNVIDFVWEPCEREWDKRKLDVTTEDDKERTLMVEDWELGALYWNCLKRAKGDEVLACQKVKEKYYDYMVNRCDLHFFLGTTKRFHNIGQNPFIIIGLFYPLKEDNTQLSLF